MPEHIEKRSEVLERMHRLDIFSELVAQKGGQYVHELDLDVLLYGRGYAGGRVGPYVRLLSYRPGEEIIREGDWSTRRAAVTPQPGGPSPGGAAEAAEWDEGNSFFVLVEGRLKVTSEGETLSEYSAPGTLIGTTMLLEGEPADATFSAAGTDRALVLEVKRPALRLLRKYPKFSESFDQGVIEYGKRITLRDVLAAGERAGAQEGGGKLWAERWEKIAGLAQFEVYDKNHELFRADEPITRVYLLRKGWVEVEAGRAHAAAADGGTAGRARLRQLGPGNCFGLEALSGGGARWRHTARLLARSELLTLPADAVREEPELAAAVRRVFSDFSEADEGALSEPEPEKVAAARREEIATGLVDATNLLVMDMDLCVRCGNCSLACHKVHGRSRLLRRGIQIERPRKPHDRRQQHVLAPMVCLHCQDPECLTGCPTGSIGRMSDGRIDIDPETCIGCGDCATQCPYNAISLVPKPDERRETQKKKRAEKRARFRAELGRAAKLGRSWRRLRAWGVVLRRRVGSGERRAKTWGRLKARLVERVSVRAAEVKIEPQAGPAAQEELLAVKCNLCNDTPLNPAGAKRQAYSCEENCPTGALARVNPREYFDEIRNVVGVIYADETHLVGRNIHRRDVVARVWHAGGALAAAVISAAAVWAAVRYGLNAPLPGTGWTLRWLTGVVGLLATFVAVAYLVRKQIYRRRAGALRYWLLAHVYSSVIAASVFLVHAGRHTGSLLASALTISFDLVILSGLFGLACYKLAPRIMSRIEGEPLLVEDLTARRDALLEQLGQLGSHDGRLRALVEQHSRPFFTARYLWRQAARREPLTVMLARARAEFDRSADARGMDRQTRACLITAIETAATARRCEALIYLHRLLRAWVAPHVAFTTLMLALLAAHIAQAAYFAVR